MLVERGVNGATGLVEDLWSEDQVTSAIGAVAWWDDLPHTGERQVSTGLLVKKIRDGGIAGYKRPHERTSPENGGVSPERLNAIRALLLAPEGMMTREQARDSLREQAQRLNTPPDALIDSAVGPVWQATPPHPALYQAWGVDWTPKDEWSFLRYGLLVVEDAAFRPDTDAVRNGGESDWSFACRFWRWQDPPELRELIARVVRERAEAEARRQAEEREQAEREQREREQREREEQEAEESW
jgi:hypothetical protein